MTFIVEPGVEPQKIREKGSKYPFAEMTPGDSFFVEATPERPRPWKAMGSLVVWANRRFAPSEFKIHKHYEDGLTLGARVWRVR